MGYNDFTMYKQDHRLNSNTLEFLKQEVELLRSLVISTVGKDREGEYRPEFIRKILRLIKSKPKHTYRDSKTFLSQLGLRK